MSDRRRGPDDVWESLGEQDADWAVASAPGKKHGGWHDDLDAFYAEGAERVAEALARVPGEAATGRALDWGSGTGRLSFALAQRFGEVTCVDVSRSMLATLTERAAARGISNLRPRHLTVFEPAADHDFALSLITLQHFPDRAAVAEALQQMTHALRPGGHLVAELPLRPLSLRYRMQPRLQAYRVARRLGGSPAWLHRHGLSGISMLCAPVAWVTGVLEAAGADLLRVDERVGTSHVQAHYVARRR